MKVVDSNGKHGPVATDMRGLLEIIPLLRRWWWLLILSALVASASSYAVTKRIKPTYEATAKILVYTNSVSSNIGVANQPTYGLQFAATIAEQITTRPVVEQALNRVGHTGLTEIMLLDQLQASADPNTPVVTITIRDTSPTQAANLTNAVAAAIIAVNQSAQDAKFSSLLATLRYGIALNTTRLNAMNDRLGTLSSQGNNGAQIAALTIQASTLQSYLSSLNTQLNNILLSQAQSNTTLTIMEQAQVPTVPVSPSLRLNLALALVLGILMAAAVIALIEYLDDSLRSPQLIEERLRLPVLATISRFSAKGSIDGLVASRPRDRDAEAFKTLRTNLQFLDLDTPIKRLLVTSGSAREGKSTVSANYAAAAAQAGLRVILVDCDLRRPDLHVTFSLSSKPGLTDFLLGAANIREVIRESALKHLWVVTCGTIPPNPSELLSSRRMNELLEAMGEEADLVILDSPPVLAVTDAAALAHRVDGVLLVLNGETSKMRAAIRTVQSLQLVGGRLLGVVLNRYDALTSGYGGYYDMYYHSGDYQPERTSDLSLSRVIPYTPTRGGDAKY